MDWLNIYGVIIMTAFMVPNIIFSIKYQDGFVNLWENKIVEIFEQIGRFGCFAFMIINIPKTYLGFWFDNGFNIYIIFNTFLTFIYCVIWIIYFNKKSVFKALSLSILPSIIFLFSGIMILSVPLIIATIIFSPCHILISYKNAVIEKM